jgi:class 3 adenylate cyclase
MKAHCPTTVWFNELKKKFQQHLEKAHDREKNICPMSCFKGKIGAEFLKKLSKDRRHREEMKRGVVKDLSIQFVDIRGFTTRTFRMPPDRIISLLDIFIPEMIHIIINRHKGMVDKLLGDGIMALYGHPYVTGDEIIQAIFSSVDMQQAASAMGQVLEISGYDPIEIGVGINYGEVLICEVGDKNYRESTVIGAPVNIAAKMEDSAQAHEILLPSNIYPEIEKRKPRMTRYLKDQGIHHGLDVLGFDWVSYLENEPKEVPDWKIESN